MNWVELAVSVAKGLGELIKVIAELAGEKTETVRARVIAELQKAEGDVTDSISGVIDNTLPDDASDR